MASLHFDELALSPSKAQSFELPLNADTRAPRSPFQSPKRANKNVKIRLLFSETETAKQNQKFPFYFFFRFAAEGWGEETREKCKEIFWFLRTRVRERVRGALVRFPTQSERMRQFQAITRSARAKWVRAKDMISPQIETLNHEKRRSF